MKKRNVLSKAIRCNLLTGQVLLKRAPLALAVASLMFGFPIFFDAIGRSAFPIIYSVTSPGR